MWTCLFWAWRRRYKYDNKINAQHFKGSKPHNATNWKNINIETYAKHGVQYVILEGNQKMCMLKDYNSSILVFFKLNKRGAKHGDETEPRICDALFVTNYKQASLQSGVVQNLRC